MISFSQLIAIFCVSIDGFCCGVALRLEGLILKLPTLIFMAWISTVMTFFVMQIGGLFFGIISENACTLFSAFTFFLLAFMALKQHKTTYSTAVLNVKSNTFTAALLCGIAVAIDASVAAFSMSLCGADPLLFSLLFGLSHFLCIASGYAIAGTVFAQKTIAHIPSLSAVIFTLLGVMRLM